MKLSIDSFLVSTSLQFPTCNILQTTGLLSPSETDCGEKQPWYILVKTGQTIDIELFDFYDEKATEANINTDQNHATSCPLTYGYIQEHKSPQPYPICGGKTNASLIYRSGKDVTGILISFKKYLNFILKFTGECPNCSVSDYT